MIGARRFLPSLLAVAQACATAPTPAPPPNPAEIARKQKVALAGRCEAGHGPACTRLAELQVGASPGAADGPPPVTVTKLYRKACEAGDAAGCHRLGLALQHTDLAKAVRQLQIGCSRGHAGACTDLAFWTLKGRGVDPHEGLAMVFLRKACGAKGARACSKLAELYSDPDKARHNPDTAYGFLRQACDAGDEVACTQTRALRSQMTVQTRSARHAVPNGLWMKEVSCDLHARGSFALIDAVNPVGAVRPALERCTPGPIRVPATWRWKDGIMGGITLEADAGVQSCLRAVLERVRPPRDGSCKATLMVGYEPPAKATPKRRKRKRRKRR